MNAEDRLREVLQREATTVQPVGDGLARIQDRVTARRRLRRWLWPAAVLVTTATVAALVLLLPDDPRGTEGLVPIGTPTATAEPTTAPQPADSWKGPAFWPYSSAADVASAGTPVPDWVTDPVEVGQRLVRDVLSLDPAVTVVPECVSCEVLILRVAGTSVGVVQLGHYSSEGRRVFTVVGITSGQDLTVTRPAAGESVSSPLVVTGRVQGVDENVLVRLVARDGSGLVQVGAPAGADQPWSATLTWTARDWESGAVVAVTRSPRDGSINRVVLVPVFRSTATTSASFAGLVDGHVSLYDSTTGKQAKQLTFPAPGRSDSAATWSAGTLAWVRTSGGSACVNELDRLDAGKASTVASSTTVRYGWPQLDALAERLAWVETPCDGGDGGHVVLTVLGSEARRYAIPSGSVVQLLDVAEDGALLLLTNDREATGPGIVGLLSTAADSLADLLPLEAAPSCNLASGAAFDGDSPAAFQTCEDGIQLLRFSPTGARESKDTSMSAVSPQTISVRDGAVLVWLSGGDHNGEIARYADGRFTVLIPNTGCSSAGDLKGCVRAPDW